MCHMALPSNRVAKVSRQASQESKLGKVVVCDSLSEKTQKGNMRGRRSQPCVITVARPAASSSMQELPPKSDNLQLLSWQQSACDVYRI